jgi:GNAT superfamily N-acetyltransferase
MEYRFVQSDELTLANYQALFRVCFPNARHYTIPYLKWLYTSNPAGVAVGFDAVAGECWAAHYVCVPVWARVRGETQKGLLSLNTATHPDFQGKGLFTKLANMTYEYACDNGYRFVYGVANANSTPGFTRRLGFQLVRPLEARLGFGGFFTDACEYETLQAEAVFVRAWDKATLRWRMGNPTNPVGVQTVSTALHSFAARTNYPFVQVYSEMLISDWELASSPSSLARFGFPKLFLGLLPGKQWAQHNYWAIPKRLKPSPLHLIYRDLHSTGTTLAPDACLISFMDFDAY